MDTSYYEFVYNPLILEDFFLETMDGNYRLKDGEMWFIAASARNKELSEKERRDLGIGGAEMYHAEVVHHPSSDAYLQRVSRFETNVAGYVAHTSRKPFPAKCLTLYATINPISLKKAFMCRLKEMNDVFELLVTSGNTPEAEQHIRNLMTRCIKLSNKLATKAIAHKNWLDIDLDFTPSFFSMYVNQYTREDQILYRAKQSIDEFGLTGRRYVIIHTKGGCHILVPTKDLGKNPKELLRPLQTHFGEFAKEITFSEGGIPLPGTLQRGYQVTYDVIDTINYREVVESNVESN